MPRCEKVSLDAQGASDATADDRNNVDFVLKLDDYTIATFFKSLSLDEFIQFAPLLRILLCMISIINSGKYDATN